MASLTCCRSSVSSMVLFAILYLQPCSGARGDCSSPYRPWKQCIPGIERCEAGYCVLRLWFVMIVALLGLVVTVCVLACSIGGTGREWSEGLTRIALVATVLIMVGTLGVIITGTLFTYF